MPRGHSKGVAVGSVLSPVAMSPMDHHAHTPVIAAAGAAGAAASPVARKHSAASMTAGTPKIPAGGVR